MKYRKLGNSGLIVSRISLGAMTFGVGEVMGGFKLTLDQKAANEMVAKAIDYGINFFDTADLYGMGQSEEILGKALGERRKSIVLATKFGFRSSNAFIDTGMSRQHIIASVEGSLRRLGTDYIDLYQVHYDDYITPLEEMAEAMDSLVKRGLVRYIGFSNFNAWRASTALAIQKHRNYMEFVSSQMYYSLVGRDLENDFVPFAEYNNIAILVWSPLAGGFLTGKYTGESSEDSGGRLKTFDFIPRDKELSDKVIVLLKQIAVKHNTSLAQVSIAWLLSKPSVTSVIIGATKMSHFEDNVKSIDLVLTEEELKMLDDLTAPALPYPNWFHAFTTDQLLKEGLS